VRAKYAHKTWAARGDTTTTVSYESQRWATHAREAERKTGLAEHFAPRPPNRTASTVDQCQQLREKQRWWHNKPQTKHANRRRRTRQVLPENTSTRGDRSDRDYGSLQMLQGQKREGPVSGKAGRKRYTVASALRQGGLGVKGYLRMVKGRPTLMRCDKRI